MADLGAGKSASRRNSDVSLGLVGVPSTQESIQTADEFMFDFDPSIDAITEVDAAINAHIDAFCVNPATLDGQSLKDLQIAPNLALTTDFEPSDPCHRFVSNEQYFPNDYDVSGLSSFPEETFAYPEPQDYFTPQEAPYFGDGYNAVGLAQDYGLGLTAIPGNNASFDYGNVQYTSQQYANPTDPWMMPAEIAPSLPVQTSYGHVTYNPYNDASVQYAIYPEELQASTATDAFAIGPVPLPFVKKDAHDELYDSDSDSDEDYRDDDVKIDKKSKRVIRKKPRRESVSSTSTSAATPDEPVKYQAGEKPQKVDAKPWIRTNANTEGDTRTAKINHWKNKYDYKPLPLGTWSSGKHIFKYTQYENVDFLTEAPMSTRKIKEYILNYPNDDQKRLILWIQKMPADQGRRYGSKQHSKCAFRDCPVQRYIEGTISTGEYRVAFDEKHSTYGDHVDPFDCTAYAHLYCMEQFLDFEQVCRTVEVRVDTRIDMPLEPNGKAAFSMVDVPARHEMEKFIKAASKGKLRHIQRWSNYPYHADYSRDQQKPHERTLTYLAHCMYEEHQDDSHKKQAAKRAVTVFQRRVHLGDLEMSVADKRIMIEVFGGKKKGRNAKLEDHYDDRILYHLARAKQAAHDFLERKRREKASGNKRKKRKAVELDETDGEHRVDESARRHTSRTCRQKKQRVNYAESPAVTDPRYDHASWPQSRSLEVDQTPEQQVQHLQTYMATNFDDTTHAQLPIDLTLSTPYGLYTVPTTPKYDISDFPTCEDDLPDDNLEKLLALERRQSCIEDFGPTGIMKSPALRTPRSAAFGRRAGFGAQPVTQSKEYRVDDPPSAMFSRRSARLAGKDKQQSF